MRKAILCIDDDQEVLRDLEAGLSEDHRLIHSCDPREAMKILREQTPALVVLEVRLAKGDGIHLIERIRADREIDPSLPILIVTKASRTAQLYGRAVQLGIEDYLSKPVPPSHLVDSVQQCLSSERAMMLTDPIVEAPSGEELAKGSLSSLPLPELLDRLHLRGATGVLIIDSEKQRTGIQLRNGSPVAVSLGLAEAFEEFLVKTGRITSVERDRAWQEMALGDATLREILIGMEVIDEEGYEEALAERSDDRILRLFELEEGRFRFIARRGLKSARSLEITSSAQSLMVRGVLARCSAESVHAALERYRDHYPAPGIDLDERFSDVRASQAQRDFIATLTGDRPVADFLSLSEFEQRTLYAFSILGVVELRADAQIMLDDALPEEEAPPEESVEVEEAEPEVAGELAETVPPEQLSDAARALEAETWFRKGKSFMKRKSYAEAVEAFGMCSHLDPAQGEYVAHLGYCLYLSNPSDELVRKEALEHIARGIKLSPEREISYVFLGRIFKVTGDETVAEQMFHRALAIRPHCREAEQELRLIELRREKSSGFLGKLWK